MPTQECPCGFYNHPHQECVCSPGHVQKYLARISGPLMDRIDLHVEVVPVAFREMTNLSTPEKSQVVRQRVILARQIQEERYRHMPGIHCNAQIPSKVLQQYCKLDPAGQDMLRTAMERLNLSARAYNRILKVARTIADLDGKPQIGNDHLAEAIHYRSLDRENWGS